MIVGPGPSAFGGATVDSPRFSRSISTISPGSLSSAYRAMKTFGEAGEAAAGIASMPPPAALGAPAGEGVVQSGQGVPGARAAYDEVIDKA